MNCLGFLWSFGFLPLSHSWMHALVLGSPSLVWLHGTPPPGCLSPDPDRPKAQIPVCYSNTMQPVEDGGFYFNQSHIDSFSHVARRAGLRCSVSTISWWSVSLTQLVLCEKWYLLLGFTYFVPSLPLPIAMLCRYSTPTPHLLKS